MKKTYEAPKLEIIKFDSVQIKNEIIWESAEGYYGKNKSEQQKTDKKG